MKTVLLTPKGNQTIEVVEDTQFVLGLSGQKNLDNDTALDIVFSFERKEVSAEILGLFCFVALI